MIHKLTRAGWDLWVQFPDLHGEEFPGAHNLHRFRHAPGLSKEDDELIVATMLREHEEYVSQKLCKACREDGKCCRQHYRWHDYQLCGDPLCWSCMLGACEQEYDPTGYKYQF